MKDRSRAVPRRRLAKAEGFMEELKLLKGFGFRFKALGLKDFRVQSFRV